MMGGEVTQRNTREKENLLLRAGGAAGKMTACMHFAFGWSPHPSSCPLHTLPYSWGNSRLSVVCLGSAHRVVTQLVSWGCHGGPSYKSTVSSLHPPSLLF